MMLTYCFSTQLAFRVFCYSLGVNTSVSMRQRHFPLIKCTATKQIVTLALLLHPARSLSVLTETPTFLLSPLLEYTLPQNLAAQEFSQYNNERTTRKPLFRIALTPYIVLHFTLSKAFSGTTLTAWNDSLWHGWHNALTSLCFVTCGQYKTSFTNKISHLPLHSGGANCERLHSKWLVDYQWSIGLSSFGREQIWNCRLLGLLPPR
jgi:hypothetical protein